MNEVLPDIKIKSHDSSYENQSDLDITVDGVDYIALWDDDEGLMILGTPALSDVVQIEVTERVKLFFTFYDFQRLEQTKQELTDQANAAMEDHLARNKGGANQ